MRSAGQRPQARRPSLWVTALRTVALGVLTAFAVRTLIAEPYSIPSGSMMPGLLPGDYLIVDKSAYGYSSASFPWGIATFEGRAGAELPKRGDVVVFVSDALPGSYFIKRAAALPGDTVQMRGGRLVLNGTEVRRVRSSDFRLPASPASTCGRGIRVNTGAGAADCLFPRYREQLPPGLWMDTLSGAGPLDEMPELTVPGGHIFVLGDNRADSADSRLGREEGGMGLVPLEALVGRASFVFFSLDDSASWERPFNLLGSVRLERIGMTL